MCSSLSDPFLSSPLPVRCPQQVEKVRLERLLNNNNTLMDLTRAQKLHLESLSEVRPTPVTKRLPTC